MRFGPATPEFTTLECVQQASIITVISSTPFARGRGTAAGTAAISSGFVALLFDRGRTAMPGGRYTLGFVGEMWTVVTCSGVYTACFRGWRCAVW